VARGLVSLSSDQLGSVPPGLVIDQEGMMGVITLRDPMNLLIFKQESMKK
jgi:hypothetical protein